MKAILIHLPQIAGHQPIIAQYPLPSLIYEVSYTLHLYTQSSLIDVVLDNLPLGPHVAKGSGPIRTLREPIPIAVKHLDGIGVNCIFRHLGTCKWL